jgi:polyisoprenoid-binding protein YceI
VAQVQEKRSAAGKVTAADGGTFLAMAHPLTPRRHTAVPRLLPIASLLGLLLLAGPLPGQQPDPFRPKPSDEPTLGAADSAGVLTSGAIDPRVTTLDSVVYRLVPSSRLMVKTGKAGLFGFAGHTHLIQARAFHGEVVYFPKAPSSSRIRITVLADSLEVLTPSDTAEIRKVTAAMHSDVLHTSEHHEITLASRQAAATKDGFHLLTALTLVGQTRELPVDVVAQVGLDTLRASTHFSIKQTDFGIKPYSGGPGGTVKVADRLIFDIRAVAVREER